MTGSGTRTANPPAPINLKVHSLIPINIAGEPR